MSLHLLLLLIMDKHSIPTCVLLGQVPLQPVFVVATCHTPLSLLPPDLGSFFGSACSSRENVMPFHLSWLIRCESASANIAKEAAERAAAVAAHCKGVMHCVMLLLHF